MAGEVFDELNKAPANRAGAWILLFVGLFGAGFGLWYVHHNVVDAFAPKASTFKTLDQIEEERLAGLKSKDTDGDGLSDYDESYVYHTSPYLKDSDGDGVDDKVELTKGTNPNCPTGNDCGPLGSGIMPLTDGSASASSTDAAALDAQQQAINAMLNPTPAQVRKFLIDSGAKQEDIDKIDDATLMQMYQDALREAQTKDTASKPAP